jgi:hypothetical protein
MCRLERMICREAGALCYGAVQLVTRDNHERDVDDTGDFLGDNGEQFRRRHALRGKGGHPAQRAQFGIGHAGFGDVSRDGVHNAVFWTTARAPLEPTHRAVGAHLATVESGDVTTGGQLGQDRLNRPDIVGVDVSHEWPGQQLFQGVPEAAGERRIRASQVPVEPRDAERIMRELEEPYQLVFAERPARLSIAPRCDSRVCAAKGHLTATFAGRKWCRCRAGGWRPARQRGRRSSWGSSGLGR